MSSSHERVRLTEQLQTSSPEVPQRPVRGSIPQSHPQRHHQPAVREIHKNAWLKRVNSSETKGSSFIRKPERLWVAFCVHDDVEAFLEFYPDPKVGATHKPASHVSLNNCQHVSSSIVPGLDNEYQFAVTLPTQVIRLYAINWDQMMEWVESLQGKLREMNILHPKDNLYSKLPECRMNNGFNSTNFPISYGIGLISTRDPNSPLPPTPNGYIPSEVFRPTQPVLVSAQSISRVNPEESEVYIEPSTALQLGGGGNRRGCIFSANFSATPEVTTIRTDLIDLLPCSSTPMTNGCVSNGVSASFYVKPSCSSRDGSGSDSGNGSGGSIISLEHRSVSVPSHTTSLTASRRPENTSEIVNLPPSVAVVVGSSNTTVVQVGCDETNLVKSNFTNLSSASPVSIQELILSPHSGSTTIHHHHAESPSSSKSTSSEPTPSTSTSSTPLLYSVVNKQKPQPASRTNISQGSNQIQPSPSPSPKTTSTSTALSNTKSCSKSSIVNPAAPVNYGMPLQRQLSLLMPTTIKSEQTNQQHSSSSENIYEHLFIPETTTNSHTKSQPIINSKVASDADAAPPLIPKRNPLPVKRMQKLNNNSNRSSSLTRLEEPNSGGSARSNGSRQSGGECSNDSTGNNRNRAQRQDVIRQFTGNGNPSEEPLLSAQLPGLEGRPMEAMIGVRSGEYRIRREELPGGSQGRVESHPDSSIAGENSANNTNSGLNGCNSSTQIPLKEQQVMRLKAEINHSGGVRVVLRKKDCVNSIAFIDYLGAVWIAGWKQQQVPVLYYAFHVGDQVLRVAGVTVQTSVEAYRAIKMVSSMQVEFILRRLPFGRVFVLKRTREGEPLGLVASGNSGELSEVTTNGLAANQGLPPKSLATDGKSNCNWFLTEVNNRPLSLMARESEVRDRLNAVGKEISILVQPADLVKHLRKHLKSLRGFKEYLIV